MITSTSNNQMKTIVQLNKKAKTRRQLGVFVVEGIRMFQEAPKDWVEKIYVSEHFLSEASHARLLQGRDYEVVSDAVFASVSDTQTPQGILCLVKMPSYPFEALLAGERTHLLVLEDIQDPGNLGTMFRTGEGAGATGIIMSRNTVDIWNPKTIRSTMGSIYRMPFYISEDLNRTIAQLKETGIHTYAAHLKGTEMYDAFDYTTPTAFLIGNEGNGLRAETADLADTYIRIPMEGQVESLNAAIAATLLMYETNRQRRQK
ncbi:MAG: TrmH family RNA methyltransferase [Lachnospiraceae bacterium]